jgi:phosphoadenosine phosphosulfate reductase
MSFDRYRTFGLREEWLTSFLLYGEEWLGNNSLGPYQLKALLRYLKEAEFLDGKKKPTPLFFLLSQLLKEENSTFVWQVVWVNLCINSELFNWYVKAVPWGETFEKRELVEFLRKEKGLAERTARNAVNSLTNTFETSPLGKWFGQRVGRGEYLKKGIEELSPELLSYVLKKLDLNADREAFEKVRELLGVSLYDYTSSLLLLNEKT